jgi:hypothetical protein
LADLFGIIHRYIANPGGGWVGWEWRYYDVVVVVVVGSGGGCGSLYYSRSDA